MKHQAGREARGLPLWKRGGTTRTLLLVYYCAVLATNSPTLGACVVPFSSLTNSTALVTVVAGTHLSTGAGCHSTPLSMTYWKMEQGSQMAFSC